MSATVGGRAQATPGGGGESGFGQAPLYRKRILRAIRERLPEGRELPAPIWRTRHRVVLGIVWVHAILLPLFGLSMGWAPVYSIGEGLLIALVGLVAAWDKLGRRFRSSVAAFAAVTSSAVLTQFSGGYIEGHFHYFIMVAVIALYQDWVPFLLAIAYVAIDHGAIGSLAPTWVYNHPDGIAHPWKWASIHAALVLGECAALVTFWNAAEKERARSDLVLKSAGEGIVGLDLTGRITFANPAAAAMTGRTSNALIGTHLSTHLRSSEYVPGARDPFETDLIRGAQEARVWEASVVRDGQDPVFVSCLATPISQAGSLVGFVVSLTDITERRRADERLRDSEARLSHAQKIAHVGSWTWDIPSNVVQWSDELYRIHGFEPGAFPLTFDKVVERVVAEDLPKIRHNLEATFAMGRDQEAAPIEYRIVRADGEERVLLGKGVISFDEHGQPARMVGTVQDITEQKRAEQEHLEAQERLREIERLKELDGFRSQFINTAAHELNTPLTPLRIQLELLKTDPVGKLSSDQTDAVRIMERNLNRFGNLITDVLDSARYQANRLGINKQNLDLSTLVQEAVESFRPNAAKAGLKLEADLSPRLRIEADAGRITQVLYNFLSNAIKFTPPGGQVVVVAKADGGRAMVSVRDTGIGLTREQISRLFQPFSQVHNPTKVKVRGTGLGLYVSRGIIEVHKGRIWCESPGPDQGATFSFSLHLASRPIVGLPQVGLAPSHGNRPRTSKAAAASRRAG